MIILHSKRAVILRTPKTGSTSLEASLRFSGCIGTEDICSACDDANLPEINVPNQVAQDIEERRLVHRQALEEQLWARQEKRDTVLSRRQRHIMKDANLTPRDLGFKHVGMAHAVIDDIVGDDGLGRHEMLDQGAMDGEGRYQGYAFIRNPFSRLISAYLFSNRRGISSKEGFHAVVAEGETNTLVYRDQCDYFKVGGELVRTDGTPYVSPLLFEEFTEELEGLIVRLGGMPLAEYPRFKGSRDSRASVGDWIDPYPDIKAAIEQRYSEDFSLWHQATQNA